MSSVNKFNLVQITDTHIFGDSADRLAGTDTRQTLIQVLDQIAQQENRFHLVVTGDISMDGSEASYRWISEQLASRKLNFSILPGNHDMTEKWPTVFSPDKANFPSSLLLKPWKLIFLDTQVHNQEYGQIHDESLMFLRAELAMDDASFLVIFMHHPPFCVGSRWIDSIGLKAGKEEFLGLINHPKVKLVVAGHVHQESRSEIGGVKLVSSPSTCVQFLPNSDVFALDANKPGYRVISLYRDGLIATEVKRVL